MRHVTIRGILALIWLAAAAPKIDIVVPFGSVPSDHMDVVCTSILFKVAHYKQQLPRNIFSAKHNVMLFEQFEGKSL